jgi:hypothetical protein
MDRQHNLSMLRDAENHYWAWLQQTRQQHSQQNWQLFMRKYEDQLRQAEEQRRITNTVKEIEATSPAKLKYEGEAAKTRADVEIAKSLELEKKRPWNPEHDPLARALQNWGEQSGRIGLAGKMNDEGLLPMKGAVRMGILQGLMDPNRKNPIANKLQGIMDQYVDPGQHDAIRGQIADAMMKGKDPEQALIRNIYRAQTAKTHQELNGKWVPKDSVKPGWFGGESSDYKDRPITLKDLRLPETPQGTGPVAEAIKPYMNKRFQDLTYREMQALPRWSDAEAEMGRAGGPMLADHLRAGYKRALEFGDKTDPTMDPRYAAGSEGWKRVNEEMDKNAGNPIPLGWKMTDHKGTPVFMTATGDMWDPQRNVGRATDAEVLKDWFQQPGTKDQAARLQASDEGMDDVGRRNYSMVHPALARREEAAPQRLPFSEPDPETMWQTYGYKRAMPEQVEAQAPQAPNALKQFSQGDELPVPRQDDNSFALSSEATQYKQLLDWWDKLRSRQNYWQAGEMF